MNTEKIIKELGGSAVVARLCEITVGAVSQWKKTGIPRSRLKYLELARPEVFQRLRSDDSQETHRAEQ